MHKKQVDRGERGGNKAKIRQNQQPENTINESNKNTLALNASKLTKKGVRHTKKTQHKCI